MKRLPTIVIADDDQDIIDQLHIVFKPFKNRISLWIATNGIEAIQLCNMHHPDLLLLDHIMPCIDGFTACQMIRNTNQDQDIDIWFLTGTVANDDMPLAIEAGADCLIQKPINISQLRHMIQRHLNLDGLEATELDFTDQDDRKEEDAA
jgi:CheY-like chemotaxis protein